MPRILISGGPGSGCTTTAAALGSLLQLPVFDSDAFFHKPTDPPFQEPYPPDERRSRLQAALSLAPSWILGGSIATWEVEDLQPTHGIFLNLPTPERLRRLEQRQQEQFGTRLQPGGDLADEHEDFLTWAAAYDHRTGPTRNLGTDRTFLESTCSHFLEITECSALPALLESILNFLSGPSPTDLPP